MQKKECSNKGFGVLGVVVTLCAIAMAVGAGVLIYQHQHSAKMSHVGSNSKTTMQMPAANASAGAGANAQGDVYEGWGVYTDSKYHYSFRYPTGWTLADAENIYGARLVSPDQTVVISYGIGGPENDASLSFTPSFIKTLNLPGQNLAVVGGYLSTSQQQSPMYQVIDASTVDSYKLVVNTTGTFPSVPSFKVKNYLGVLGSMSAEPTGSIESISSAKAWLDSDEAKTSLLILQSLKYDN